MRAAVGHLNRNIKIIGTDEFGGAGWGGRVLVYSFNEK